MYYDYYSDDFDILKSNTQSIINNQNNTITILNDISLSIKVFCFVFIIFFIYFFIRNMLKR